MTSLSSSTSSAVLTNTNKNDEQQQQIKQFVNTIDVKSAIPKRRQELLKWNGWGYKDSYFLLEGKKFFFTGKRYPIGDLSLPHFYAFAKDILNVDPDVYNKAIDLPIEGNYEKPQITEDNLNRIILLGVSFSVNLTDRIIRAHGQTLKDIYTVQHSQLERIPDIVLWPNCHNDVVNIVNLANANNMVIIPFGGGTSVSGAIDCPLNERRTIISLDTSQMNRILWVDKHNLVACCESGIFGQDLERELKKLGFTTGHEPDSYEFSSLGGWVATRASGMKKNTYGNIEDILVHVRMVTPNGVLEKNSQSPRLSCGPDFNHVVLGSEGTLGVITEVIIKIRPFPKVQRFGSIAFPNFQSGINCMREVAKRRCQPSSIRLMDNGQFQFGMILKPESTYFGLILDGLKKFYITKIKRFDVNQMCVMTLLFEGDADEVQLQEKKIYDIGKKCDGIPAGQTNGERGYMLTFVIAYVRDVALRYNVVAESFETSVPWDRVATLCQNVKQCVTTNFQIHGINHYLINCRITQTYDAGCVVYFYLAFNYTNIEDPVHVHEMIEEKARDEVIACGGSISHHHGIGKLRKKWYPSTVSRIGVNLYLAIKNELDPNNIFATDNFIPSKL